MGANQQKALKFRGILANLLSIRAYRRFSISQILAAFMGYVHIRQKIYASMAIFDIGETHYHYHCI